MAVWVTEALRGANLGDPRRTARLYQLVEDLAAAPSSSVPQACGDWAGTKAAYRFWDNEHVEAECIRAALANATAARADGLAWVLGVQDTTALEFGGHAATSGLGLLGPGVGRGLWLHTTLAVDPCGVPVGVLGQELWAREGEPLGRAGKHARARLAVAEKESYRWLSSERTLLARLPAETQVVTVADQEADMFDLFHQQRRAGAHLLIRACHGNRRVSDGESITALSAVMEATAAQLCWLQEVSRRPGAAARLARVEARLAQVWVQVPSDPAQRAQRRGQEPVEVWAVLVVEPQPPPGTKPLRWLLLTTLSPALLGLNEAAFGRRMADWYGCRWLVERYHLVLKSGCRVEHLQLQTAERLERALATYAAVAWGVLWLDLQARASPEAPCTVALTEPEWQALWSYTHDGQEPPNEPPTVREAVRAIAKLGGFLGRKGDREPGPMTLWRGLLRLHDITNAWLMFRARAPSSSTCG